MALGESSASRIVQTRLAKAAGKPLKFKMVSGGAQFEPRPKLCTPGDG